jgi:hypothetical protein
MVSTANGGLTGMHWPNIRKLMLKPGDFSQYLLWFKWKEAIYIMVYNNNPSSHRLFVFLD